MGWLPALINCALEVDVNWAAPTFGGLEHHGQAVLPHKALHIRQGRAHGARRDGHVERRGQRPCLNLVAKQAQRLR